MRRGLLFFSFLLWIASAQAAGFWDELWHNADQQGERLLHQGDAAAAAQTFRDPRHKAYAELQAGDYENAAKHLSAFDDSNGHYNRGNALAKAGQLEEALKAYDAALAHDPKDKDARHNRDLVAKALQQQKQPKQSSADDKGGKDKDSGKDKSGQSGKDSQSKDGKQDKRDGDSGKQGSSAQDRNDKSQAGNSGQDKQGKDKDEQQGGQAQQQSAQGGAQQPDASAQAREQSQADEAAQAKRDAAAALGKPQAGGAKPQAGDAKVQSDTPVSEQQLAQEQWLRAIPDDPGGLLRRKFMIQHLIRQQGGEQ